MAFDYMIVGGGHRVNAAAIPAGVGAEDTGRNHFPFALSQGCGPPQQHLVELDQRLCKFRVLREHVQQTGILGK